MRIGFCGTQSVGKTTLVNVLKELPEFKDYIFATERSKYLRDLGIPLNTDSTVNGQIIFMAERASELLRPKLLTDRTIWDVLAFTLTARSINEDEKQSILLTSSLLFNQYDIIFYISPEGVELENNNVRCIDPEYRIVIDNKIKYLLQTYPPKKLIKLEGSTQERINKILNTIKNNTP
jgi:nicotinamide riboside kinase